MQLCIPFIVIISQKTVIGYQNVEMLISSKIDHMYIDIERRSNLNDKYLSLVSDYRW